MKNGKWLLKYFSIVFAIILALFFTLIYFAIDHNSQGEYCEYRAYRYSKPQLDKKNYVIVWGKIITYDKVKHLDHSTIYVANSDEEILDSNWIVQGNLCKLTQHAFSLVYSALIGAVVYATIIMAIVFLLRFIFGSRDKLT